MPCTREVVDVGVLDLREVPEGVPRRGVAVVAARGEAALLERLPAVHPCREEPGDVADLLPAGVEVLVREVDVHEGAVE
eukprot:4911368-Alexandrium_andersonii.AAC.1